MTDPAGMEAMMGMMKGNMAMIVPQTLIMSWINAFFSGYVVCKFIAHHQPLKGPSNKVPTLCSFSEAAFPSHDTVQIDVTIRSCHKRP